VLAEAIKLFKYNKKVHIGTILAEQMMSFLGISSSTRGKTRVGLFEEGSSPHGLVPVPLHPKRLCEREFNQSAIIASVIGKRMNLPVLLDVLIRRRHTRPQVELDMKERRKNVTGVFAVENARAIEGKDLVLIDDVFTTGATVSECARTLKRNGAGKVYIITIARMIG